MVALLVPPAFVVAVSVMEVGVAPTPEPPIETVVLVTDA